MAVNKVVMNTENGEQILVDLTGDSVTPETLAEGATAHDASGNMIVGEMQTTTPTTAVLYTEQTLTDAQKAQARKNIGLVGGGSGDNIIVDSELSETSENPVQNKVVTQEFKAFNETIEDTNRRVSALEQGGVGGGVSSWNDLTDKPFGENEDGTIKQLDNKYLQPFERQEESVTDILAETSVTFSNGLGTINTVVPFVEGETYYVVWDGTEYICIAKATESSVKTISLGNTSMRGVGDNTGEPFCINHIISANLNTFNISTAADVTHTVRIYQGVMGKWLLKKEYLPNAAGGGSAEFQIFDLTALGLPPLEIGKGQTLTTDTTEIMAALNKGIVAFGLDIVRESGTIHYNVTTNILNANGTYFCYYTGSNSNEQETISIAVGTGIIIVGVNVTPIGDSVAPHIGDNGNWFIGDTDTGVKAVGENGKDGIDGKDGVTPHIGANGNWFIGDTDTGVAAGGDGAEPPTAIDISEFDANGTIVETYADGTSKTTTMEFDDKGNPIKVTDGDGNVTELTGFEMGGGGGSSSGGGVSSWNDLTDKPFGEEADGTIKQLDNKYLEPFEGIVAEDLLPRVVSQTFLSDLGVYAISSKTTEEMFRKWQEGIEGNVFVEFDGVVYECAPQRLAAMDNGMAVGNCTAFGGVGNNEPFIVTIMPDTDANGVATGAYYWAIAVLTDTASTEHQYRIYQPLGEPKYMLKESCLPFNAIAAYIDNYIDEALGGDY